MKKCSQCGSLNDDEHSVCTECRNRLGEPLSKNEAEEAVRALESLDYQEHLYEDPFEVTKSDKVFGVLAMLGFAMSVVLFIIMPYGEETLFFFYSCLLFVLCISYVFLSNAGWRLHKGISALHYRNSDSLEPSDFSLKLRKICIYVSFFAGVFIMIFYVYSYESGILDFVKAFLGGRR